MPCVGITARNRVGALYALAFLVAASLPAQPPKTDENQVLRRVRIDDVIAEVSDSLSNGYKSATRSFRSIPGLTSIVDDISSVGGFQYHDFSSETLLTELYRRAEAGAPGQGEKLLAYLYRHGAKEYGSFVTEPAFESVRKVAAELPSDFNGSFLRFASAEAAQGVKISSPVLEAAVTQLAYAYGDGNLPHLRSIALRAFENPNFSFERAVAESKSTRDAIARMFDSGLPPPSAEVAGERLMRETLEHNGAARESRAFVQALEELRGQLGLEKLGSEQRAYVTQEDGIPSRTEQRTVATQKGLPWKVSKPGKADLLQIANQSPAANQKVAGRMQRSAQEYSNYNSVSVTQPPDTPTSPGGPAGGGGGGGGGGGRPKGPGSGSGSWEATTYSTTRPPSSYTSRTGGAPPVSSSYRGAIRSARAGRGVAVGATVSSSANKPVSAAWLANQEDGRFGRFVVQMPSDPQGQNVVAASRTIFEDSFYAAVSVLAGGHYGSTAFREGHVLIVMSMDPFAKSASAEQLEKQLMELAKRAESVDEGDLSGQIALIMEAERLQQEYASLPRKVVVHPALYGRELAWSAVRADFWLNDRAGLSKEGSLVNGGRPMPQELLDLDLDGASTWQYFERDSKVVISGAQAVKQIVVRSTGPEAAFKTSDRSHFSLSMFGQESDDTTHEPARRKDLEVSLQPMLDWLATNHHDFMRLNDFSEALSLLRWLQKNKVTTLLIDMNGEPPLIATPNQVVIGEGPKIE